MVNLSDLIPLIGRRAPVTHETLGELQDTLRVQAVVGGHELLDRITIQEVQLEYAILTGLRWVQQDPTRSRKLVVCQRVREKALRIEMLRLVTDRLKLSLEEDARAVMIYLSEAARPSREEVQHLFWRAYRVRPRDVEAAIHKELTNQSGAFAAYLLAMELGEVPEPLSRLLAKDPISWYGYILRRGEVLEAEYASAGKSPRSVRKHFKDPIDDKTSNP